MGGFFGKTAGETASLPVLVTPNLVLRPFCQEDLDAFFDYARDPRVGPPAGWKPHDDPEETWDVLQGFIQEKQVWAVEERKSRRLIGSVGLHPQPGKDPCTFRMLGYALGAAWWGKGYATEMVRELLRWSFEEAGLEEIIVRHFPFNLRSRRVIEKAGFRKTGELPGSARLWNGAVYDQTEYSMTREAFEKLRKI